MLFDTKPIALDVGDINILESAKSYLSALLEYISSAENRIYITALYLQDDDAGRIILDALYQAKQRRPKLNINIFVDAHRAQRGLIGEKQQLGNRALYLKLAQQYGDTIKIYGVAVKNKELFGVLHLKGMVFDDHVLYTGASINDVYCHQHDKYRLDRYYILKSKSLADSFCQYLNTVFVDSELAPQLNVDFYPDLPTRKSLVQKLRKLLSSTQYKTKQYRPLNCDLTVKPLVGFGARNNQLNKHIRKTVQHSVNKVVIFTPYFNMPKVLVRDLAKALRRGVNVEITVGDKTANDFFIEDQDKFSTIGAIPYLYEILLVRFVKKWQKYILSGQLTIRLWKHDKNSYHLKGIISDDRYHLITGSNVNPRAWALDLENGLLIDDKNGVLTEQVENEIAQIYQHTTVVKSVTELQSLRDYPLKPQKLIKKLRLTQIDRLLKRLL